MRIQEQASGKLNTKESPKQEAALESSSSSSVSVTTINSTITTNISITTTASINTTSPIVTTSPSSTFSDNLALSRLGSVELSFQPQLGSEFSQAFSEFQNIAEEKEKIRPVLPTNCDATAFINRTFFLQTRMFNIHVYWEIISFYQKCTTLFSFFFLFLFFDF